MNWEGCNEVVNRCPSDGEVFCSVPGDLCHMGISCRVSSVSEKQKSRFSFQVKCPDFKMLMQVENKNAKPTISDDSLSVTACVC